MVNGLSPEAAVFRIAGRQWTLRDEVNALILEAVDRWGWFNARLQVDPEHHDKLPDAPISVPRPAEPPTADGSEPPSSPENQTEKDRYQKQRERIAFFT